MMLTNRRNGLKTIRYNSKGQVPRAGLGREANLPSEWLEGRADSRQEGQSPGLAAGRSVGLSKFNTNIQDSPSWINKVCGESDPPAGHAVQVQLSVYAETGFPDAQQLGSCLEKQPGARKKQDKPCSFGVWDPLV